jgi:hypothetical protein
MSREMHKLTRQAPRPQTSSVLVALGPEVRDCWAAHLPPS